MMCRKQQRSRMQSQIPPELALKPQKFQPEAQFPLWWFPPGGSRWFPPGFPQVQHFHGQQVVVEMVYEEVAKEVEEKCLRKQLR